MTGDCRRGACSPGRRPPGVAVLRDGRRLRRVGVPAEDLERLARALEAAGRAAIAGGVPRG